MYISSASIVATLAFLSPLISAAYIGRLDIEARDNVAACKAILVALKASQFCSSFVPIKDVTSTETKTGPTSSTKVTFTAPCTPAHKKQKRGTVIVAPPSTTASFQTDILMDILTFANSYVVCLTRPLLRRNTIKNSSSTVLASCFESLLN
jgi:hypothetical protein